MFIVHNRMKKVLRKRRHITFFHTVVNYGHVASPFFRIGDDINIKKFKIFLKFRYIGFLV